ncbi:hypothetical protein CORC01_13244 [Colletotrichum orchidophilum]|uniref:Uncharacterized protein n=1 Tax=Colletotrichum orchidophilum TaxID=1209926 RepID=A0A1G4AR21_9PEZI|nr:uncharacterized protein CORC01_13244 [Colletotrichum orchidophilum]OHE91472.1 hypothetical protein CORC01_13244 [Colletotrichum orchidophilum]
MPQANTTSVDTATPRRRHPRCPSNPHRLSTDPKVPSPVCQSTTSLAASRSASRTMSILPEASLCLDPSAVCARWPSQAPRGSFGFWRSPCLFLLWRLPFYQWRCLGT